nr:neutral ceramidase [Tanacetum cinerariifolium]
MLGITSVASCVSDMAFWKAVDLFNIDSEKLNEKINFRHTYLDLTQLKVTLPKQRGGSETVLTCPAAMGFGFAAGTIDGAWAFDFKQRDNTLSERESILEVGAKHAKTPSKEQKDCQQQKHILLDTGEMKQPYDWAEIHLFLCYYNFLIKASSASKAQVEVGEDVARVREYRGVICGLKIAMRRREECIRELKALGDCEGAVETVKFMEEMQLDDIDKCNRSVLLMREIEDKARVKSRAMDDDVRLARQINALCDTLTKVIEGRENFVAKLDMLGLCLCQKRS